MDKVPVFIKKFSKKEPPEERQRVVESIKVKRQEHFTKIEFNERKKTEI
jgi:hypothetical protein